MKVGLIYTIIRKEEILIADALSKTGIEVIKISDKSVICNPNGAESKNESDLVLCRNLSLQRAFYCSRFYESIGLKTVNSSETISLCGDKFLTNQALAKAKLKTPKAMLAFHEGTALEAVEKLGYPCVIKPVVGSWGRLIAKIDTREAAEAIIEHKKTLGSYMHSVYYVQEYIDKLGRDIRTMVIGNEAVGAIYRNSKSFKTNTALGAEPTSCELNEELKELSIRAAEAVGGGIVSVDLFETGDGLAVNEVNALTEFRKSINAYNTDIPEKIAEYIREEIKK